MSPKGSVWKKVLVWNVLEVYIVQSKEKIQFSFVTNSLGAHFSR